MITIYLKQSYNLLKENLFVNGISIAGTALSVAAVMLIYPKIRKQSQWQSQLQ